MTQHKREKEHHIRKTTIVWRKQEGCYSYYSV